MEIKGGFVKYILSEKSISEVFPVPMVVSLNAVGIYYMKDLKNLSKKEILDIPGIGLASYKKISDYIIFDSIEDMSKDEKLAYEIEQFLGVHWEIYKNIQLEEDPTLTIGEIILGLYMGRGRKRLMDYILNILEKQSLTLDELLLCLPDHLRAAGFVNDSLNLLSSLGYINQDDGIISLSVPDILQYKNRLKRKERLN